MFDVIVIGGGAAGFYTAIHIAEAKPHLKIAILERGKDVLGKVKVSGGGRCNVTHAEFDPRELTKNYPRGEKELIGPFHTYCSGDTIAFFEERGITLKIESDGRMFPESDSSQTIIDCFLNETNRLGVKILKHSAVSKIEKKEDKEGFKITTIKHSYECEKLVVATGSNPKVWKLLENMGHTIVPAVPSLFTFNCKDQRIAGIPGVSTLAQVEVFQNQVYNSKVTTRLKSKKSKLPILTSDGPLLITHWGLSGPAILKLSAWGARLLNDMHYKFKIRVNWLPDYNFEGLMGLFLEIKEVEAKKTVLRTKALEVPRRLWTNLVRASGIDETDKWADVTKNQLEKLAHQLVECELKIDGKSTFKEEFVTAGGIDLKEVNFKTYESKKLPGMYFAGEVINVDAITGGFNFQNAWTGGYIAAQAVANNF
ncbi:BaiN/RdsA family NAD(P)/FAD-dependent oxidoreductase [Zobellia russellii]|uniref:NAD(P)/FAD-dependent oxidoreductase n=1 Tax=Zobellia russellii TaxID=248907 RepID=UPI001BFFBF3C|nr:NAD(P)/FAD-dependent oxidoreductase [Zobellia russellii]MBT9187390.1 NAD(P)/FAD-dependent oxidoreductase [Zobellia russellii]